MKKNEIYDIIKILFFIVFLFGCLIFIGCNNGWSVGNLDVSPSDSIYVDYLIITDQDSSQHWYVSTTDNNKITVGENYCYKHHIWENVKKKSE